MVEVERATWEISCRNCDRTKPGEVIPESPQNGFLISRAVLSKYPIFSSVLMEQWSKPYLVWARPGFESRVGQSLESMSNFRPSKHMYFLYVFVQNLCIYGLKWPKYIVFF